MIEVIVIDVIFENSLMVNMVYSISILYIVLHYVVYSTCIAMPAFLINVHITHIFCFFNLSSGAGESLWGCISIKCQQRMEQSCTHRHLPHRKWCRQNQLVRNIPVYKSLS